LYQLAAKEMEKDLLEPACKIAISEGGGERNPHPFFCRADESRRRDDAPTAPLACAGKGKLLLHFVLSA